MYFTVAAQEGPGIVIGHPGQDVELLCTVMRLNDDEVVAWLVNHGGPYGVSAIRNGIWAGYSANGNNLLVESIMMNDIRNRSDHRCVITTTGTTTILRQSDPTILYVAGEYQYRRCKLKCIICDWICKCVYLLVTHKYM